MDSNKPFFHEISDADWEALKEAKTKWSDIVERYEQPTWCQYPEALGGIAGCWSLMSREVRSEGFCKNCDLYDGASGGEALALARTKEPGK